jgi:hypothetical protein
MDSNEIKILIKDVSARFPYGVICQTTDEYEYAEDNQIIGKLNGRLFNCADEWCNFIDISDKRPYSANWGEFRPFLRRMSSMTKDELNEYKILKNVAEHIPGKTGADIDFLLERHIDFRNLIDAKLAIEVTPENNPYK